MGVPPTMTAHTRLLQLLLPRERCRRARQRTPAVPSESGPRQCPRKAGPSSALSEGGHSLALGMCTQRCTRKADVLSTWKVDPALPSEGGDSLANTGLVPIIHLYESPHSELWANITAMN